MIWLWAIFFSAAMVAGPVTGTVELVGSRDPAVQKRRDYSGVVVWLDGPGAPAQPRRAEMVQKNKRFLPHVLAIPVGSTVEFPNFDLIFHNAFSNFSGQLFDVGLYPPGTNRTVVFKRQGIARVFCNIHPTMSAVIAVLRTPYFAVSGKNGAFEIRDVPLGEYHLRVFHERASEDTLKALERRITVNGGGLALPAIAISESGYIQFPHKNKYGKDYPPVVEDHVVYPGARK